MQKPILKKTGSLSKATCRIVKPNLKPLVKPVIKPKNGLTKAPPLIVFGVFTF